MLREMSITGAEVVNGDRDPLLLQLAQLRGHRSLVRRKAALGQFENQLIGFQLATNYRLLNVILKSRSSKLSQRRVD